MLVSKCSVIVFKSDKQVAMVPDDVQASKVAIASVWVSPDLIKKPQRAQTADSR